MYYNIVPEYCISVDEKFLNFQNVITCTNLTSFLFCSHWSHHVTLMPKYGHKAPESICITNFFLISIRKVTLNNFSYLLPQKLLPTPLHRLVYLGHNILELYNVLVQIQSLRSHCGHTGWLVSCLFSKGLVIQKAI